MTVRQVAISYCSSEFLGMHGELVTDCYVFNLEHTTRYQESSVIILSLS